jgi:starch synthase
MERIKLLYVSAEISSYASAGGLGEVAKGFTKAMSEDKDYEVYRAIPLHKGIQAPMEYLMDYPVSMGEGFETCVVKIAAENQGVTTYFIGNDRYFNRASIYGYEDDGFRFFFFCKAILELLKHLPFHPDLVHTNDWHTGFLPLLLKKEFPSIKSVYTIHNISYQGYIPASFLKGLSLTELYSLGWPEWLNFMKAGILYSDLLTTVSPGYCEEMKQADAGYGMTPLLESRKDKMIGILNGIDAKEYNPDKEGELAYPFNTKQLEKKTSNRLWLKKYYGLSPDDRPFAAMITRLDYSKGIDLLLKAIRYFDFSAFQLLVLGTGNPYYQGILKELASAYPDSIAVDFTYSEAMAKRIYAGADLYLMPSLFEPCGVGQLYAMRYGAVPVVNPVGGLKDTVIDYERNPNEATGFYMKEGSPQAFHEALSFALKVYHSSDWEKLVQNCMRLDSSWEHRVRIYKDCYRTLLER